MKFIDLSKIPGPFIPYFPTPPRVGDKVRTKNDVKPKVLGTVVNYDGLSVEILWDIPGRKSTAKYGMDYFRYYFCITAEPNDLIKEIL